MGTDRGVDAAAGAVALPEHLVERLSHAVQALELVAADVLAGHVADRRHGVRVVGRELRVEHVAPIEQAAGADEVGQVGVGLAREHREGGETEHLRLLDLAVPVGALDQAHHDATVLALGQRDEPVDERQRAPPVPLHDDAETVPAVELGRSDQRLDQVERQVQPVGLLGVDVEADAGLAAARASSRARGRSSAMTCSRCVHS